MAARRLIINADDLGLTAGVNRAVAECHDAGAVTSSTLMAGSGSFADAVRMAQARPKLGIGCHVTVVDDVPLRSPAEVPTLLATGTVHFRDTFAQFARAVLGHRVAENEVALEAAAQFQKLRDAGINITHFDSHKHAHLFPCVLRPLLRTARDFGMRALRNPFAPVKAVVMAHIMRRPQLWVRYSEVWALRYYAAQFRAEIAAAGLKST